MSRVRPSMPAARSASRSDASHADRRALALKGYCRKHGRRYPLNVMWQGHPRAHGCIDCHPALAPFEPKPWTGWTSQ